MDDSGDLCEILKFSDEPRSWFVDNSIQTGEYIDRCGWGEVKLNVIWKIFD